MAPDPACAPTELLVLAHGLQGAVEDFSYVLQMLNSRSAVASGQLLLHASRVNTDKTHDGIDLGGLRLAEDIRDVVRANSSLRSISLVGFSLGGLYVRYAAAHLYDQRTNTIAGLVADKIVIVASPNLGVRHFGLYRFLQGMLPLAHPLLFESAKQLFLRDEDCLLERMTRDCHATDSLFMSALRAFNTRMLYANVRNDFMVNYGTAALDAEIKELSGNALQRVMQQRHARRIDEQYDERGCQICFEMSYEPAKEGGSEGAAEAKAEAERAAAVERAPPATSALEDGDAVEREMARRLRSLGWSVVAVDFPMPAPLAHNRIVAMSRNGVHSWMNAGGRRVVHHLADALCAARAPAESALFCAVRGAQQK